MANQDFRVKNGLQVGVGGTILKTIANGNIGINSTQPTSKLDVNGDVNVSGASTFVGITTFKNNVSIEGSLNVGGSGIGNDITTRNLNVSGVSTFTGAIDANGGLNVSGGGGLVANTVQASNLSDGRVVLAAGSGQLSSNTNLTFDGTQLAVGVNLDVDGHTELDNVNVSGVSTFASAIDANSNLDVDGHTELDDVNVSGVSTFTGTINANGDLDVDGHTELDNLNVSGISTFQDDIHLGDGDKINLGDNDDFQIFHHSNGTGIIQNAGSGQLQIRSDEIRLLNQATDEDYAFFRDDGAVELYYDNSKKFETIGIGISVLNGSGDTATIAGPANLIIDPGVVGDNTGIVRIKGDLIIDGVETKVNSTTVEIADKVIGIATTCTSDLLTDGAGIGIGSDKTFLYEHNSGTNPSLKSSENLNVPTGKGYQVNQTEVLNATTLGSNVVNSSLTNVGTLTGLDVNVSGVSTLGTVKISSGIVTAVSGVVTYYGDGSNLTGTDIPGISTTGTSTFNNIKVSGVSTFLGSMTLQNNQSFDFGGTGRRVTSSGTALILATDAANDIKISANAYGSNQSDVEIRTGSDGGKVYVTGTGGVGIYHTDTALKLETTGYGVSVTGDLNASGISSAAAFANFDYLQAPFGSTVTFTVTVASKDASHRYNGTGSGNAYLINGVQAPFLTLTPGRTYRFTNNNTGSHPLKFYLEADKTTEYTSGVSFQNTYTEITVSDETPTVLHYQCTAHGYMGNAIQVNSNVVNTNYDAVLRGGLNVSGASTFVGISTFQDTIVLTGVGKSLSIGPDNSKLQLLYDSNTGQIVHNETLFLTAKDGITFLDDTQTREIANFYVNGSTELMHSNNTTSSKKFETTSTGVNVIGKVVSDGLDVDGHTELDNLNVSGVSTFVGISSFNDDTYFHGTTGQELFWDKSENILDFAVNASAGFGNSNQLKVSGGVSGGTIELSGTSPTSGLFIKKDGTTESIANFIIDGAVDLYYDNSKKFETTGYGVSVTGGIFATGIVTATKFIGDGSELSNLPNAGFSPDADENLVAGTDAGANLDGLNGCFNVFLGSCTGKEVTSGDSNVAMGKCSSRNITTGRCNISLGTCAGIGITSGSNNIMMGTDTGCCTKSGNNNIIFGQQAGKYQYNTDNNIFIGKYAGRSSSTVTNNTGGSNIAMGGSSGYNLAGGIQNIFMGYYSGYCASTGKMNLALGYRAGERLEGGCCNVFIGNSAGICQRGGYDNISIGTSAGRGSNNPISNAGTYNIYLGAESGRDNKNGSENVFIGHGAGNKNDGGNYNVMIGCCAGDSATNSNYSIFLGGYAGRNLVSGSGNIAIGFGVSFPSTTDNFQTAIGFGTSYSLYSTGSYSTLETTIANKLKVNCSSGIVTATSGNLIYYGDGSKLTGINTGGGGGISGITIQDEGSSLSTEATTLNFVGAGVTASGTGATKTITINSSGGGGAGFTPDSQYNLYAGTSAGAASDADTCFNVGIGYEALKSVNEGDNNVAIGPKAGMSQTSGYGLIAIGCCAGAENETGNVNIALGYYSLNSVVSGNCNIALGFSAGSSVTGDYAVFIGANAGKCATTVNHSIGVGDESLRGSNSVCNTGCYNIALGCGSGRNIQTGSCNIFLGTFAGYNHTTGIRNTFLGHDSGKSDNFGAGTGNCNTAVGDSSMCNIRGGHSNTAIGHNAGRDTTDGFCNVFLGVCAGNNVSTGSCNIAIGPNVRLDSITGNCQFAIGVGTNRWITGDSNFNIYDKDGNQLNGASGGGITVQDEGSSLSTTATTLNFVGSGVVASGTGATKTITIAGGASQDVFRTIAVSGQSDVVADSATDTLTLVAGSNMTITTDANTDTITFASSGGGGGTVSSGNFTASAGSPSTINTYAYNSAELVFEYTVFVKNGSDYQSQKLLVMRDGTTVHSTQYGVMYSNNPLVELDATISGSNLLLRATPETGVNGSTTYRLKREVT